jgi:AraC-like DNA-binding protein
MLECYVRLSWRGWALAMQSPPNSGFMRFSTQHLPASERVPLCREVFGRQVVHLDIEPLSDQPFVSEASVVVLPGAGVICCNTPTPTRWMRTKHELTDGNDDLALLINVEGAFIRSQRGQDIDVGAGQAVWILNNELASLRSDSLVWDAVMTPRSTLSDFVSGIEDAARRPVPRESEALRLLRIYLGGLQDSKGVDDPSLAKLVAIHVQDLVAITIGATRDGAAIAMGRGVRAARIKAIKADFAANPQLSLAEIAARQRVTPRYVQRLFDETGETFTAFAMEQRLTSAYRMLRDERFCHLTIAAIAYWAGFGDLSHFNRNFKRRFGETPGEIRRNLATTS